MRLVIGSRLWILLKTHVTTSEIAGLVVQLLVAAGTGALAFFTWRLAKSTSRSVSEAQAERKLTEQALEASNRIAQAAENELTAMRQQVAATQTIADEAVKERNLRWEPLLAARLSKPQNNRPTDVTLENLGAGPAIDCVYVTVVTDEFGMKAWYMVGPLNLLSGERQQVTLNVPHGIEQGVREGSDDTSVEQGRRVRRFFEIFVRAFEGYNPTGPRAREMIGQPLPQAVLFDRPNAPSGAVDGQEEAFLCRCANGHVHRLLPHLMAPQEQFDPNDVNYTWLDWYKRIARRGLAPPAIPPKPDARQIRSEPI